MKKEYQCEICYETFSTKKDLVYDLRIHFEEGTQDVDTAVNQLEEMGIKNPYLP